MSREPSIAGIRFFVSHSSRSAGAPGKTKFQGTVSLVAHFDRDDLWEAVIRRLHGLELYKGGDIQSELIEILQGRLDLLEKELEDKGTEDRQRAQRAEQSASIATADKVRAEQQAELLKAQLGMKQRELEEAYKANQSWRDWYEAHNRMCHTAY